MRAQTSKFEVFWIPGVPYSLRFRWKHFRTILFWYVCESENLKLVERLCAVFSVYISHFSMFQKRVQRSLAARISRTKEVSVGDSTSHLTYKTMTRLISIFRKPWFYRCWKRWAPRNPADPFDRISKIMDMGSIPFKTWDGILVTLRNIFISK